MQVHIIDANGVYQYSLEVDPYGPQPSGAIYEELPPYKEGYTPVWVENRWKRLPSGSPPVVPEPIKEFPKFYGNDKLDLFTPEEQLRVVTATMTDAEVKLIYDRLINAMFFTYENPETEYGLSVLVVKNLITQARKDEIVQTMQPR